MKARKDSDRTRETEGAVADTRHFRWGGTLAKHPMHT